jgi:5-methylcytosine-specific restriction protein A
VLIATKADVGLLRKAAERDNSVEWVVPKTAHPGDEAAIFLSGSGFVAMGRLATEPALGAGFGRNEKSWRADVRGVRILEEPVPIESVEEAIPEWKWPRYPKSLTTVPTTYAAALRAELTRSRPAADDAIPEQAGADEVFTEGATTSVRVNAFETSAVAKRRCVEHYGCRCAICGLKFDEAYGPAGEGLIHVHHLVPLALIRREYEINPVKDLRPVCPNCHALIHRRTPPYSPAEVKSMLSKAGRK